MRPLSRNPDYFLDISQEVCPITFVRTKLLLERMAPGEVVEIRLAGGEPLDNVPRSAAELGHAILATWVEEARDPPGIHRLLIEKRESLPPPG